MIKDKTLWRGSFLHNLHPHLWKFTINLLAQNLSATFLNLFVLILAPTPPLKKNDRKNIYGRFSIENQISYFRGRSSWLWHKYLRTSSYLHTHKNAYIEYYLCYIYNCTDIRLCIIFSYYENSVYIPNNFVNHSTTEFFFDSIVERRNFMLVYFLIISYKFDPIVKTGAEHLIFPVVTTKAHLTFKNGVCNK